MEYKFVKSIPQGYVDVNFVATQHLKQQNGCQTETKDRWQSFTPNKIK